MAVSQFTIYTANDPQGPGALTGQVGSLTNILDYCLVNGYGTGSYFKQAAGWSKPLPNISASAGANPQLACYKQGSSGSNFTLFVNDFGANANSLQREAWICGFEAITSLTGSGNLGLIYTASNGNGAGYGQFPLPSQLNTYGHCVVRKSSTADSAPRFWVIAADSSTMYMWILSNDTAYVYQHWGFGDFFSYGLNDNWNCFIYGRAAENTFTGPTNDYTSGICQGNGYQGSGVSTGNTYATALPGHYLVRSAGGTQGSLGFTKKGDSYANGGPQTSSPTVDGLYGVIQAPNMPDNSFYFQPLTVIDPNGVMMRGRFRGLYQSCHPLSTFADGQTITAGGDYAGKTFMCIKTDVMQLGSWMLETSPTVETN